VKVPPVKIDVAIDVRDLVRALSAIAPEVERDLRREISGVAREIRGAIGGALQRGDSRPKEVDRQTRTFQLGASGRLELESVSGDITVTAGPGGQTTVEIVRESHGRTAADAKAGLAKVTAEVDERAQRVSIRASYAEARNPPYSVSISYIVTTPAGTGVRAHTISGDVVIKDVHGEVSAETISGDVRISNAARIASANATSGSVTITDSQLAGSLEAGTINGDVVLRQVKAERIGVTTIVGEIRLDGVSAPTTKANAISGGIALSGPLAPRGRYDLQSHSGDITVTVTGSTGLEFEGSTFSGHVRGPDLPTATRATRGRVTKVYGDGGAIVSATTFSGNIVLVRK